MSVASYPVHAAASSLSPFVIEEDSTFFKAISYIPLWGIIPSVIKEISLAGKIRETRVPSHLVKLVKVINQYKIANAVRSLLTAALIVTGIALGILTGNFASGAILSGLHIGLAGLQIHQMNQYNQILNILQVPE